MAKKKKRFVAVITDEDGVKWVYEGMVESNPIWVKQDGPNRPELMTEAEAWSVATQWTCSFEEPMVFEKGI